MLKPINTAIGLFCLLAATGASAERIWPDNKFECQVVSSSGARGLVSLQTYTRQDARRGVIGLNAVTDKDNVEEAASVVQCIDLKKGERFRDLAFQSWRDSLEE
ncbi:hypothetical protein [Pseudohalioglobus lutimaris]|uniref:Uncharacterized protein n=1 Tax=Pseudohalioglobus lutimaris TaxID=1737061 RepID=A0A2N5WZ96_9GAMM|nr:hypothetical protein [Pseudohalioglobus lutimaris]PLW67548.1 hypothetical protein C0039_16710 [Pseudohalioglobus lutimaris]